MSRIKRYVYIGPSLMGLHFGNIFIGSIPNFIKDKFNETQGFEKLFVKAESLADAEDKLKKKGTGINLAYESVLKARREGVIK